MISVDSQAGIGKQMSPQGGRRPSIGRKLAIIAVLAVPVVILGSGAHAAPFFLRTNTNVSQGGGGTYTSFEQYTTLSDLASDTSTGITTNISPVINSYQSIFFDGASYYKTMSEGGGSVDTIFRYDSYQDLATNTSGTRFAFSQVWGFSDAFFADGLGNYYVNDSTASNVTQYPSFTDLVNDTNGLDGSYTSGGSPITWGADNRFFAYEGTFYRTNTNGSTPGSIVTDFVTYSSYANLLVDSPSGTISSGAAYPVEDQFIAVPVPEPSAWALGVCGVVPYFCWAARRSRQRQLTKR